MGRGNDNFLDGERADEALLRLLARSGEPVQLPPPPDLVTRTARRLPSVTPARAAQLARRRRITRLLVWTAVLGALALLALVSLLDLLGSRSQFGLLFGDGGSDLGRALLQLHLLAKPLLWTVGAIGAPLGIAGLVALAGGCWLWWWLMRRTPGYVFEEQAL